MEKARKIKRSELWNQIHEVVSKIPRKNCEGDAADASSVSTELEKLFLNLKSTKESKREILLAFSLYVEREYNCPEIDPSIVDNFLNQQ